ncbi:nitrite reductase (NAD(P)H), small subunit [Cellulomonas flavigena DSM 20109]|uniref:Nitrite reductase (NAD(P)H), small subunit n=1 Tax=Cellulomonas flavigena (strain ATCC 482 / DSM 20109 / BCRC 11376 / JCM 18109 / NBRC 3775 / NCIMB 8073 / NRS 134) TaxID=446466 RepID=D5UKD8_CELFN|nr:nitrite reductase small subunit NirD [Cellulomonas flavigena]ADG75799.1 nitrite reductase (NAD(P)H), small subunit [Cellulomonas flavigena DSM 20109]
MSHPTPATATPTPDVPTALGAVRVCALDDLLPERGAGAIVGEQRVALFRLATDEVLAVQQRDPYSGANVLSRGLVGDRAGEPTVTSPMYKQVWDLRTGACLDPVGKDPVDLRVHAVAVVDGQVLLVP